MNVNVNVQQLTLKTPQIWSKEEAYCKRRARQGTGLLEQCVLDK